MIERNAIAHILHYWKNQQAPKPLILYGAPQTGKSTVAREILRGQKHAVLLNLSESSDRKVMQSLRSDQASPASLFYYRRIPFVPGKALVIIDDLHEAPGLADTLHRWACDIPGIKILALTSHLPLPDSRFEFIRMHPLTFSEFLNATGDQNAISSFAEVPFPVGGFHSLLNLFNVHTLIGGMPEVVAAWLKQGSTAGLDTIYEKIMDRFRHHLDRFATNDRRKDLYRLTFLNIFPFAAERITLNHFGNTPYGSRDIHQAITALERLMAVTRVYPSILTNLPSPPDPSRSPRIHVVDTGLVNHAAGIFRNLAGATDLSRIFHGQVLRHMAGQEIIGNRSHGFPTLRFWTRPKLQSSAETDYLTETDGMLVPVMVRPGEPGRLRSLHRFLDEAPHPYAVRLHTGNVSILQAETIAGKRFFLLNLPYFLASRINEHLKGFIRFVNS